jgi:hypothetical protein
MKEAKKSAGRPPIPDAEKRRKVGVSITGESEVEAKRIAKSLGISFSAFVEMAMRAELDRRREGDGKIIETNFERPNHGVLEAVPKNLQLPYYGAVAAGLPAVGMDVTDDTHPVIDHCDPASHFVVAGAWQFLPLENWVILPGGIAVLIFIFALVLKKCV